MAKTFNSGDSPVVTYLTTSPPVRCFNRAERTGSLVVTTSVDTKNPKLFVFGTLFFAFE
jgi:hypothetical protein